jgi:outer membrane autotransporter protein
MVTDATIGTIKTIDIQKAKTLIIDANAQNVNLLSNGTKINFIRTDSTLTLTNTNFKNDMTITLGQGLAPQANEHGKVVIDSRESSMLTLTGNSLGTNDNRLKEVTFIGDGNHTVDSKIFATKVMLDNSTTTFTGNLTAANIAANNATLLFKNNFKVTGDLIGNNTEIDLGNLTITYEGQAKFSGIFTINLDLHGNIIIAPGSKLDLSQVNDLVINLNNITETKILISGTEGSIVAPANNNINIAGGGNQFIKYSINENGLSLIYSAEEKEELKKEAAKITFSVNNSLNTDNDFKDSLNIDSDNEAKKTQESLDTLGAQTYNVASDEFVEPKNNRDITKIGNQNTIKPSSVVVNHVKHNINNTTLAAIGTRVNQFTKPVVSSGDETAVKAGIWASPFIGNSKQKLTIEMSDYKTKSSGATIGFDSFITDDLLLGTYYTKAYTKIRYKNEKLGDESKIDSNIFSVYGLYDLPNNNWFVSGIALYSNSLVKNYSQRSLGLETAISKHKSHSYTGQILTGYNHVRFESVSLKPMIGIRYSKSRDASYVESGTSSQNLMVKGTASDSFEGILGFRTSKHINTGHMILTPELYSFVHCNFKDNSSTIEAKLFGTENLLPSSKVTKAKTSFNCGTGVTVTYKMMECGINYNVNIANKYFAQQGSLKIRMNF